MDRVYDVQWRGGEDKKVVSELRSGLGGADGRWEGQRSNRCQKMHSKCEVQSLYSPGIAQDCVVTIDKV